MGPDVLVDLISGGGVLGFAFLVLRLLEKLGEEFQSRVEERDARIAAIIEEVRSESRSHEQVLTQVIEFYRSDMRESSRENQETHKLMIELTISLARIGDSLAQMVGEDTYVRKKKARDEGSG